MAIGPSEYPRALKQIGGKTQSTKHHLAGFYRTFAVLSPPTESTQTFLRPELETKRQTGEAGLTVQRGDCLGGSAVFYRIPVFETQRHVLGAFCSNLDFLQLWPTVNVQLLSRSILVFKKGEWKGYSCQTIW